MSLEQPYGHLAREFDRHRFEGEPVPWGATVSTTGSFHWKSDEFGIIDEANQSLLNQALDMPSTFVDDLYTGFGTIVVSPDSGRNVEDLFDVAYGDVDREVDGNSLLCMEAGRALVGDKDNHLRNYAVRSDGSVYTFDLAQIGIKWDRLKLNDPRKDETNLEYHVEAAENHLSDLGLEVPSNIKVEIRGNMSEIANSIDLEIWESEYEDQIPDVHRENIRYNVESARNF